MNTPLSTAAILFFLSIAMTHPSQPAVANEFTGVVETQVRAFFNAPLYPDQHRHNASLAVAPEYYHRLENFSSITIAPFLRADSADGERSHFDVREMNFLWLTDAFELKIGISKVFWGAAEFVHLVDIINQTDLVEAIDMAQTIHIRLLLNRIRSCCRPAGSDTEGVYGSTRQYTQFKTPYSPILQHH